MQEEKRVKKKRLVWEVVNVFLTEQVNNVKMLHKSLTKDNVQSIFCVFVLCVYVCVGAYILARVYYQDMRARNDGYNVYFWRTLFVNNNPDILLHNSFACQKIARPLHPFPDSPRSRIHIYLRDLVKYVM